MNLLKFIPTTAIISSLMVVSTISFFCCVGKGEEIVAPQSPLENIKWQEYLRQNPQLTSISDYLMAQELNQNLGLDQFLEDAENFLNRKISASDLQKKVALQKKIAFGESHRQIWLDTLEKTTSEKNNSSLQFLRAELRHQLNLANIELDKKTGPDNIPIRFKLFIRDWKDFPIVVVDGLTIKLEQILLDPASEAPLRYYFISPNYQPVLFIGTQSQLIHQHPLKIPLDLKNISANEKQNKFYSLSNEGRTIDVNSTNLPVAKNWWLENKKWALPLAIIATGALISYGLRDQQLEVQMPSF